MKVQFEHPLSDTQVWQGRLKVTATVDRKEVEIDRVVHEDKNGKRSDITYLVEQWGDNLYEHLQEMARNNACNLHHPELEDYTLANQ